MVAYLRKLGPGLLVAAAFLGPGTITTASTAGAANGFQLLWALLFGVAAAIVLQEMTARLGIVTRAGLGEALRSTFDKTAMKLIAAALVIAAIGVGGAAFESGNITGAVVGAESIIPLPRSLWAMIVGGLAFALLWSGVYKAIERVLIALVIVMSVVFLVTAIVVRPDFAGLFAGFVPSVPAGALLTIVALVGTTVVPYNFFLHAASVREKWDDSVPTEEALSGARFDTAASIGLGGLVTLAVMTTAAAAFYQQGTSIESAADMARQLEPLLGAAAGAFFAIGLVSAGVTSAITAPLASAYAICGVLGWSRDLRSAGFRSIWMVTLLIGVVFAVAGGSPLQAIVFAQAMNGILLPVVAVFLLLVMNRGDLLGEYVNKTLANVLGGLVVLIAAGLGFTSLLRAARVLLGS